MREKSLGDWNFEERWQQTPKIRFSREDSDNSSWSIINYENIFREILLFTLINQMEYHLRSLWRGHVNVCRRRREKGIKVSWRDSNDVCIRRERESCLINIIKESQQAKDERMNPKANISEQKLNLLQKFPQSWGCDDLTNQTSKHWSICSW